MSTATIEPAAARERQAELAEQRRHAADRALAQAERANQAGAHELGQREQLRQQEIDRLLAEFDRRPQESLEQLLNLGVHVSPERVEWAYGRLGRDRIRQLLAGEARLHRGRLIPVVRGGVVGMAPANFRNAPAGTQGKDWDIDPATFYALTVRNEQMVPAPSKASGWDVASPLDFPLSKRGILSQLFIVLTGTMTITPGTGTFTQGWKWPMGNLWHVALQAGGESSLQYGTGNDFWTRVQRLYRDPFSGTVAGAGTGTSMGLWQSRGTGSGVLQSGANSIKVLLPVPVAHDLRTGMGSIFRPAADLQLTLHIDPPTASELIALTGNATAVWSNVNMQVQETYFRVVKNAQGLIVLPDISRVFMTTVEEQYFSNNGAVDVPIPRLPGTLLCMSGALDMGNTAIAVSSLSDVRMTYGENQQPLFYLPDDILEQNRRNYDVGAGLHAGNYFALDGEVDNPARDVWIPRNFTEGELIADIPGTITPQANSRFHTFLENLVQANLS